MARNLISSPRYWSLITLLIYLEKWLFAKLLGNWVLRYKLFNTTTTEKQVFREYLKNKSFQNIFNNTSV